MFGKDFLEGGYNPEQFDIQMDAQGNTLLVPKRPIQANPLESLSQLGGAMTQGAGGLAELVGELSGVAGTADVLSGEGEPLDYLDALGLAADIGTPGIPLTPMIAGLGMADSIPRLAGKIDARSLGGVVDAVKNMLGELVTAGHVTTESDIDILGDAIQKMDSFRIDPMKDEVRQVVELFGPEGQAFPAGVQAQASRSFANPEDMRIPGFHDASGDIGRELENTLGPGKARKVLRAIQPEMAGAERATFQRAGGVEKAAERAAYGDIDPPDVQEVFGNTPFADAPTFGQGVRSLDFPKTGERTLQQSDPFRDFLFTVLANTRGTENLQSTADTVASDLLGHILNIGRKQ